jgi:signal transduction histidine kinase
MQNDAIRAAWPLEATGDDNTALPPPWDGDVDFSDEQSESALLALQHREPLLALRICRGVFCRAEARGDRQAALHALHLACITLQNSSQFALADQVFDRVRERAQAIGMSALSIRIELARARRLSDDGEHAKAMVLRQWALDAAMASGDIRTIFTALGGLATSAIDADEPELALSLCEQQEPMLTDDDVVIAAQRSQHANNMALAWMKVSQLREADGDHAAARAALQHARGRAQMGCDNAKSDRIALYCVETLVQVLLRLNEAGEARTQVDRCTARLAAPPGVGSWDWCELELARMHIETHDGRAGALTLQRLLALEASTVQLSDDHTELREIRDVLLRVQEQLGHHEQALATHKRATGWLAHRRSAHSRQRLKMLRHTVLSMRAEAVEFIAHDLLTPLAAAQTWLQAIDVQRQQPAVASPLGRAHGLVDRARTLSGHYLDLLRAELMPRTHLQVLDFGALADDVCENMVPAAAGLRLVRTIDIGTPVCGDARVLGGALAALLADAFGRAPAGTHIELHLRHDTMRREAVLSIRHAGAGPAASVRARLCQQSFDGEFLGANDLGLVLAAKVCRLHRMRLRFDTARAAGSTIRLMVKTAAGALNTP